MTLSARRRLSGPGERRTCLGRVSAESSSAILKALVYLVFNHSLSLLR